MPDPVLPSVVPEPPDLRGRAAVALVFGPQDRLLFIQRAEREGDPWSGHMAFPGGRHQAEDPDVRRTAERETREEIGLDLVDARYLGALPVQMSPFRDPRRDFGVFPFVYRVDRWGPFVPEPSEVAAIHLLDAERLLSGEGRGQFHYTGHGWDLELPCVRLDGTFIWGMTLRMLDQLVAAMPR